MALVDSLKYIITADAQGFITEIGKAERAAISFESRMGIVGRSTVQPARSIDSFTQTLDRLGAKAIGVGKNLALGLTLPLGALAAQSVKAASAYYESINKVRVVFKSLSDDVMEFTADSAEAFGQSRRRAMDSIAIFGNLFVSLGLSRERALEMSKTLTVLATDLASLHDIPIDEAFTALRSGIIGEIEPMRRLGVNLNDFVIRQEAMRLGLDATTRTVNPLVKAIAAYHAIMRQTATAQGDFKRTQFEVANQMRTMSEQYENAKAALGDNLRPAALKVLKTINDLLQAFRDMAPATRGLVITIGTLAVAAGPVSLILGMFARATSGVIGFSSAVANSIGTFRAAFQQYNQLSQAWNQAVVQHNQFAQAHNRIALQHNQMAASWNASSAAITGSIRQLPMSAMMATMQTLPTIGRLEAKLQGLSYAARAANIDIAAIGKGLAVTAVIYGIVEIANSVHRIVTAAGDAKAAVDELVASTTNDPIRRQKELREELAKTRKQYEDFFARPGPYVTSVFFGMVGASKTLAEWNELREKTKHLDVALRDSAQSAQVFDRNLALVQHGTRMTTSEVIQLADKVGIDLATATVFGALQLAQLGVAARGGAPGFQEFRASVEEAKETATEWGNALQNMASPMQTWETLLKQAEERNREYAESVAKSTETAEDSWEDYVQAAQVSLKQFNTELERRLTERLQFAKNILTLQLIYGRKFASELARMGPEAASIVAKIAAGGDEARRTASLILRELEQRERLEALFTEAPTSPQGEEWAAGIRRSVTQELDLLQSGLESAATKMKSAWMALRKQSAQAALETIAAWRAAQPEWVQALLGWIPPMHGLGQAMQSAGSTAARQTGVGMVSGLAASLPRWVQTLIGYGQSVPEAINPTLAGLGRPPIRLPAGQALALQKLGIPGFAAGGIIDRLPSKATIQPPGTLVQWAEPETHGEAFIPLAPAKRRRSVQIWRETGRRLGVLDDDNVAAFAAGGIRSSRDVPRPPAFPAVELARPAEAGAQHLYATVVEWARQVLDLANDGTWRSITRFLENAGIPHRVISTVRPGARTAATGAVSLHALGRAVDLTGPGGSADVRGGMRIWQALDTGFERHLQELIYSHAPTYIGRGIRRAIGWLHPVTRATHWDHVHAGVKPGEGALAPGIYGDVGVRGIVAAMAAARGWVGAEWAALERLIQGESSWNPMAVNPRSSARGLFQFLDSTRRAYGLGWPASVEDQTRAGLQYIADRYGSPSRALRAWQSRSPRWYAEGGFHGVRTFDEGGVLQPGITLAVNRTRRPELVLPPDRTNTETVEGHFDHHISVDVNVRADEAGMLVVDTRQLAAEIARVGARDIRDELSRLNTRSSML